MKNILAPGALAIMSTVAFADAPEVPTEAPYIVLSENLDEPNGYGFCIDTYGAGQSDLMQTHTCKPQDPDQPDDGAGNDTRFLYNSDTGQVASYTFDGYCMQALVATGLTVFAMLECSDHPRQQFVYDAEDKTLRLTEDSERCVAVAPETVPAGPWVKRPLTLEPCEELDASLKQWTVVEG